MASCAEDLEKRRIWGDPAKLSIADELRECRGVRGDPGIMVERKLDDQVLWTE